MPHNLRLCDGDATCEDGIKADAADDFSRARYCLVGAGDTPSTGRMYDAIACLCVPLIAVDDLQLPFGHVSNGHQRAVRDTHVARGAQVPSHADMGVRVREAQLLANPEDTVTRALMADGDGRWAELQTALLRARRWLSYRAPGSLVASMALREAWSSCVHTASSGARPPSTVAKC